jgi:hypothetical protein
MSSDYGADYVGWQAFPTRRPGRIHIMSSMHSAGAPLWSLQGLIFFASLVAFAVVLYRIAPILTRRRLERWARSQGLHLIESRTMPIWEGPRAWRRNRYKWNHRIVVEDSQGRRREGWLFEDQRFLNLGRPDYRVEWDVPVST